MTIPFLSVKPKSVKLKVSPRFPAQLLSGICTVVRKSNGNYYIDLNYSSLPISSTPPPSPNTLVYDNTLGTFTLVPTSVVAGGIGEAPINGFSYGRLNATWAQVAPLNAAKLTGNPGVEDNQATFHLKDLTAGADAKTFDWFCSGGQLHARCLNDAYSASNEWLTISRTGYVPTLIALRVTTTAPTPASNDNSTNVATTAFVNSFLGAQAGSSLPIVDGTAAVGVSLQYARQDHVHPTDTSRLAVAGGQTLTGGFTFTPYNGGTVSSGTFTPAASNGNYQYYTNNGAHTLAAPTSDCAIDILVTNGATAGAITFTGFTVAAGNTGDPLTTTNTSKFIISVRRINAISTYVIKALQ